MIDKVTSDYWKNIPAGKNVADGFNGYRTAPSEPGMYTLYELYHTDSNTHAGWEWVRNE